MEGTSPVGGRFFRRGEIAGPGPRCVVDRVAIAVSGVGKVYRLFTSGTPASEGIDRTGLPSAAVYQS